VERLRQSTRDARQPLMHADPHRIATIAGGIIAPVRRGIVAHAIWQRKSRWQRNARVSVAHSLHAQRVHEGLARVAEGTRVSPRRSEFRAALTDAPRDDELHTGLGRALMQLGDVASARHEFEMRSPPIHRTPRALRRLGGSFDGRRAD